MKPIMTLQAQHTLRDKLLKKRLDTLLPEIMTSVGINMWILIGDEYNEGPCFKTFLPSSFSQARRKMIFIFVLVNGTIKRFVVSKPDSIIGEFYEPIILKTSDDPYSCVNQLITDLKPTKIGLDYSNLNAFSDGLSHNNYTSFISKLDEKHHHKVVSSELLSTRWLETRLPEEIELMKKITLKTREIIHNAYSRKVIQPGVTTIGDVRYYLMETAVKIGMRPWFDATVWVRRQNHAHLEADDTIILNEDLLHCDFGVSYACLCSDVQEMAYVKGSDDQTLLDEYHKLHRQCMKLQDIVVDAFKKDDSGNTILHNALKRAQQENINGAMIYTHPIGVHGHGAGPIIGQFSNQKYVDGMGEYPLHNNTCYALELCIRKKINTLNDLEIMYGQEINISFVDEKVHFYAGRQEQLHII